MSVYSPKIHLFLDSTSRMKARGSLTALLTYDLSIINSFKDLTPERLSISRTVVLLEDGVRSYSNYSDLILYKEVFDLEYIFISSDDFLLKLMSPLAKCCRLDPIELTYDKLTHFVFGPQELVLEYGTKSKSELKESAKEILESTASPEVKLIADSLITVCEALEDKLDENRSLKAQVELLQSELQYNRDKARTLENLYTDMLFRARQNNSALRQYEAILSKDIYEKIELNKYTKRPRIIYFKEFQQLAHMGSFIDTLFSVFKFQGRKKDSVKVLQLFDSSSSKRILTLPKHYFIASSQFYAKDVIAKDFIVKVGDYKKILDFLLTNSIGLDLLIIVDCKDHSSSVISGQSLQFSMCRNPAHIPLFNIEPSSTIVNNSDAVLSWDHYEQYSQLDEKDKFLFLSSRPIIQAIYEMDKTFNR